MFDLRTALVTTLNGFTIQYLDTVSDQESTARALEQLERVVFDDAAVILGDWTCTLELWVYGSNRVRNVVELVVCAKSSDAKAAISTVVSNLAYNLNRSRLGQTQVLMTHLANVQPLNKTDERIWYHIAELEVLAIEAAPAYEESPAGGNTRGSVSITSHTGGETVSGNTQFTGSFSPGSVDKGTFYVMFYPVDPLKQGTNACAFSDSFDGGGDNNAVQFGVDINITEDNGFLEEDYTLKVFAVDTNNLATDATSITLDCEPLE